VKQERTEWKENQLALDGTRLVLLDETGANTHMTRTRGRSPRGERCRAWVPGGHWKTTTFLAALRVDGITAPMVLDGPMHKEAFLAYVREFLAPTLRPGDIVLADNLSSHKNEKVREEIEARGATILYLPPYSPDLNPIEMVVSKLKAMLRKAARRTSDALWNEIGYLLDTFSPYECAHYFKHAGYNVTT
jgi:transposase